MNLELTVLAKFAPHSRCWVATCAEFPDLQGEGESAFDAVYALEKIIKTNWTAYKQRLQAHA